MTHDASNLLQGPIPPSMKSCYQNQVYGSNEFNKALILSQANSRPLYELKRDICGDGEQSRSFAAVHELGMELQIPFHLQHYTQIDDNTLFIDTLKFLDEHFQIARVSYELHLISNELRHAQRQADIEPSGRHIEDTLEGKIAYLDMCGLSDNKNRRSLANKRANNTRFDMIEDALRIQNVR